MEICELSWWNFSKELEETSMIECPECKKLAPPRDWKEGEVGCEDCGTHSAIICPNCDEYFDHVSNRVFNVL